MLMIQTGRTEKEITEAQAALKDTEGDFFELQDKNIVIVIIRYNF
jgi:hypothetical protein